MIAMGKPYMPLMMGDWIRGTRGMKAEVRGVYIDLLIHQYDHGFLPSDFEELCLIAPELPKVWVKLKDKFEEFEPGKLQNKKLEEVRNFFDKQGSNGKKGGRPKKENPKPNPTLNPKENPKHNLHNEYDIDIDIDLILNGALDEIYLDQESIKWPHLDFSFELNTFKNKVRGSPEDYRSHDTPGIRKAFQYQLRNAKHKFNGTSKDKRTQHLTGLAADFAKRASEANGSGQL